MIQYRWVGRRACGGMEFEWHGAAWNWGGMGRHGIRAAWGGMELGWHRSDMPLGQHAIGKTWGGIALGWHGVAWN